jgi:hypothetical protein
MIKLAKLSSIAVAAAVLSGCTYSSDAIFPSLFGTDSQEKALAEKNATEAGIILGTTNFEPVKVSEVSNTGTFVGQKVITFRNELNQLQNSIQTNNKQLQEIRTSVVNNALQYHKTVGMIEAKLQVGTTPGNPQMFEMLAQAQNNIQTMSTNSAALNQLSAKVAADTANTDYLVEAIRSAYSISGAVDEDHRQLRILENEAGQTSILMHSLLGEVSSDISRQQQYIDTANNNIAKLSDAIRVGSYGVSNVPLSRSPLMTTAAPRGVNTPAMVASGKPLFAVKFASANVKYKDGLKQAVGNAVAKKNDVIFDVVAVNPTQGASAQEYASKVFQDIISFGVSADRVNISAKTDAKAKVPAVMVFVR